MITKQYGAEFEAENSDSLAAALSKELTTPKDEELLKQEMEYVKENFDYEVICCCIDCGQGEELDGLEERAKLSGASKLYIENIVDEFCDDYIVPCVQANAIYENKYLLGTAMARPGIAKKLVEIARKEHALSLIHILTLPTT